jgi:hypothetical protein
MIVPTTVMRCSGSGGGNNLFLPLGTSLGSEVLGLGFLGGDVNDLPFAPGDEGQAGPLVFLNDVPNCLTEGL